MVGFMVLGAQSLIWGCDKMQISQEMGQVGPHLLLGVEVSGTHAVMAMAVTQASLYGSPLSLMSDCDTAT